jgi:hypothetical protein
MEVLEGKGKGTLENVTLENVYLIRKRRRKSK